jgi:hypothetical protein
MLNYNFSNLRLKSTRVLIDRYTTYRQCIRKMFQPFRQSKSCEKIARHMTDRSPSYGTKEIMQLIAHIQ